MPGGLARLNAIAAAGVMTLLAACATTETPGAEKKPKPAEVKIPAEPVFELSDILGADPRTVDGLLGPADLTRREGEGEYRRYGMARCALIIILYPDSKGDIRAAHVDAAALRSGEEKPDLEDCLAAGKGA